MLTFDVISLLLIGFNLIDLFSCDLITFSSSSKCINSGYSILSNISSGTLSKVGSTILGFVVNAG